MRLLIIVIMFILFPVNIMGDFGDILRVPGFGVETKHTMLEGFGKTGLRMGSVNNIEDVGMDTKTKQIDIEVVNAKEIDTEIVDYFNGRRSYRVMYDLLIGAPLFFIDRDFNKDGQISMWEFADEWNDAAIDDFFKFDLNRDGIITAKEISEIFKIDIDNDQRSVIMDEVKEMNAVLEN